MLKNVEEQFNKKTTGSEWVKRDNITVSDIFVQRK